MCIIKFAIDMIVFAVFLIGVYTVITLLGALTQ